MYQLNDFSSAVQKKQNKKLRTIIAQIQTFECPAFKVRLHSGFEQIYVVPNAQFIEAVLAETKNSVGFNLVSLYGPGDPLAFDKDQPYLKSWSHHLGPISKLQQEPIWIKNWHLWFRVNTTLYNNSLARFITFKYPNHYHVNQWSNVDINPEYPYSWMNLMIEPIFFFPKNVTNILIAVMNSLVRDSYQRLPENNEYGPQWDEHLAFSQPQNRQATYEHLRKHDHLLDASTSTAYGLPFHKFGVTATQAEAENLEKSNCLNLAFLLGEQNFITALEKSMDPDDAAIINFIGQYLSLDRDKYLTQSPATDGCYAAYNMGILLSKLLSVSPIVYLNGALPTKFTKTNNLRDFDIPLNKLGVSQEIANLVADKSKRMPL